MNEKDKTMNSDAKKTLESAMKALAADVSQLYANFINGERLDKGCSFEFSQERFNEEVAKRTVAVKDREKQIIERLLESLTDKEWKSEVGCKVSATIEDLIGIRALINYKKGKGISLSDNEIMYLVNVMNEKE